MALLKKKLLAWQKKKQKGPRQIIKFQFSLPSHIAVTFLIAEFQLSLLV